MTPQLEACARAICRAEGIDPEHPCAGLGRLIPRGEIWPAWRVRVRYAQAVIDELAARDQVGTNGKPCTDPHWPKT